MLIYLVFFSITILCAHIVERVKSVPLKRITFMGTVLFPSFLAGIRASTVGTDVLTYVRPIYWAALSQPNLLSYRETTVFRSFEFVPISNFESGYTFLVYLTTKVFGNFFSVLFVTQLLITGLSFVGLWKLKKIHNFSFPLSVCIYLFFFYNPSLNMVRQSIAMAFIMAGFPSLFEKKYIKYMLYIVCACFFHKTAVIGMICLIVFAIFQSRRINGITNYSSRNARSILILLSIILASLLIVFIPPVTSFVFNTLHLSDYENGYLKNSITSAVNQIVIRIPIIIVILTVLKKRKKETFDYICLSIMAIEVILSQLASGSVFAVRVVYYLMIFYCAIVPMILFKMNRRNCAIGSSMIVIYSLVYWWYNFIYLGYNATVPFSVGYHFNF